MSHVTDSIAEEWNHISTVLRRFRDLTGKVRDVDDDFDGRGRGGGRSVVEPVVGIGGWDGSAFFHQGSIVVDDHDADRFDLDVVHGGDGDGFARRAIVR